MDDIAIVLGVFNEKDELMSSLRGEFIRTRSEAEEKLHYSIPKHLDLFPGILLGRGATKRAYRNYGFNSLLRFYYLGLAIDFPFKSTFASVFEKAPRIGLLRDMNYRFTIPDDASDDDIHVLTREYFVYLERKHFLPSFQFLQTKFATAIIQLMPDHLVPLGREFPLFRVPIARLAAAHAALKHAGTKIAEDK